MAIRSIAQQPMFVGCAYTSQDYIDVDELEKLWRPVTVVMWPGLHEFAGPQPTMAILSFVGESFGRFIAFPGTKPLFVTAPDTKPLLFDDHWGSDFQLSFFQIQPGYMDDSPPPRPAEWSSFYRPHEAFTIDFESMRHESYMLGVIEECRDHLIRAQAEGDLKWERPNTVVGSIEVDLPFEETPETPAVATTGSALQQVGRLGISMPSDW